MASRLAEAGSRRGSGWLLRSETAPAKSTSHVFALGSASLAAGVERVAAVGARGVGDNTVYLFWQRLVFLDERLDISPTGPRGHMEMGVRVAERVCGETLP